MGVIIENSISTYITYLHYFWGKRQRVMNVKPISRSLLRLGRLFANVHGFWHFRLEMEHFFCDLMFRQQCSHRICYPSVERRCHRHLRYDPNWVARQWISESGHHFLNLEEVPEWRHLTGEN